VGCEDGTRRGERAVTKHVVALVTAVWVQACEETRNRIVGLDTSMAILDALHAEFAIVSGSLFVGASDEEQRAQGVFGWITSS
jgi:hypothetical protein